MNQADFQSQLAAAHDLLSRAIDILDALGMPMAAVRADHARVDVLAAIERIDASIDDVDLSGAV